MLKALGRASPTIARPLGVSRRNPPRLISRVWLYGPTDGGSTPSRTVNQVAPAGAGWVDARGIGAGGGRDSSGSNSGGGAAYARGGVSLNPGAVVVCTVAGQASTGADGVASTASAGGKTFMQAAGGKKGTAGGYGAGAAAVDCIGTTIRAGGAGGAAYGGLPGSDAADADSLGIGGNARVAPPLRVWDGTAPPILTDYGAGGSAYAGDVPASPLSTGWSGDGRVGGPGIVVLEFWSKKPT